jgi:hypothetical protein
LGFLKTLTHKIYLELDQSIGKSFTTIIGGVLFSNLTSKTTSVKGGFETMCPLCDSRAVS